MAHLEVVRMAGFATVQDTGRPGRMHEGVPAGGPLVTELFARANAAARNPASAATIEVFGRMTLTARGGPALIALDDGVPRELPPGVPFEVGGSATYRVRYIAVRGGVDVPVVLGSRGTLVVAGIGGFEGRALRAGDRLPVGDLPEPPGTPTEPPLPLLDPPIDLVVGPDDDRFEPSAVALLLSSVFTLLPASDRTGTLLRGPILPRRDEDDARSTPMVAGGIEVPSSGGAIVLGPDHPTTGGYPVIAVVTRGDLGRFAARRAGTPVRFRAV